MRRRLLAAACAAALMLLGVASCVRETRGRGMTKAEARKLAVSELAKAKLAPDRYTVASHWDARAGAWVFNFQPKGEPAVPGDHHLVTVHAVSKRTVLLKGE